MINVLSFVKLFSHDRLKELNITDLYKGIDAARTDVTSSTDGILLHRTDMADEVIIVAHRVSDGQTWVKWTKYTEADHQHSYDWKQSVRDRAFNDENWDISFISPEISLGTTQLHWRSAELARYPELLAFIAAYITDTLDDFKQMITDSIVTVDHKYDVFMVPYTGQASTSRTGDYVFITGQQNGKLFGSINQVMHKLNNYSNADTHIIPYIGTLVSQVDFNELTEIARFTQNIDQLNDFPNHLIVHEKARSICEVVDHINEVIEETVKERMKNHVQTVTYDQFMSDDSVKEHVEDGGKVNLLLNLTNMTW